LAAPSSASTRGARAGTVDLHRCFQAVPNRCLHATRSPATGYVVMGWRAIAHGSVLLVSQASLSQTEAAMGWENAMDCCGHDYAPTRRNWIWGSMLTSVGAMLAGGTAAPGSTTAAETAANASAALGVLRRSISVDVHTHGGTTGITSKAPPSNDLADGMRAGSLAVACLADVPDGPVLGRNAEGVLAAVRTPEPGQLYRHHLERLDWIDRMVAGHGLTRALSAADLDAAHAAGQPAIVGDVEGLDFLDGRLERLEEAHRRGVRHVQLVHYTPNDIGDFQTGAVTHHGLTEFGAEAIRACHRLGFVCDVAHATEDTVMQAVKVATKPLLLSHTALEGSPAMGPTRLAGRQISRRHAEAIAATGGSIGIWHFFPSLDRYVDGVKEMVEIVGVDHVSIGTDQQTAPGIVQNYAQWVELVAAMLRGGFRPEEAGKIAGGNYLRIFRAAVG
jgi:membrane dipeptidase